MLKMQNDFSAIFQKVPEGYIGFVEELPGANTQGRTLKEARSNLVEAIQLTLEEHRVLAEELRGDVCSGAIIQHGDHGA
ncbi:MAG TPA: type II toxin-antitoxin system HicB family antitoxin [Longimicrobium sp.]|nr:type II toxin-antitoxin system HicB family antitoxin [Longimicrobium sp.]